MDGRLRRAHCIALIYLFALISGGFCYGNLKCAVGPHRECVFNVTYGNDIQNINDVGVRRGRFENTFIGFANLEGLSVDYMPVIFKKLPELRQLFVKDCQTVVFKEELFENAEIMTFIASNNSKLIIEDNAFRKAKNLELLLLDRNGIESIPKDAFNGLDSLKELHLDDNEIKELMDYTFEGTPNLKYLSLANNSIRNIRKNTFAGLRKLKTLNLSANPIEETEIGFFKDLPEHLEIHFDVNSCIKASDWKIKVGNIRNEFDECFISNLDKHLNAYESNISRIETSTKLSTTSSIEPSNFNYFYLLLILIFIRVIIFAIFIFRKM